MLIAGLFKRGWKQIKMWREIARERSELRRLSETLAKDIGISRAEAEREADRPFWDCNRQVDCVLTRDGKSDSFTDSSPPKRCLPAH
jgi:uncharacterized protein YjiS (DUF1127 family)